MPACKRCGGYYLRGDIGCPCQEQQTLLDSLEQALFGSINNRLMGKKGDLSLRELQARLEDQKIRKFLISSSSSPHVSEISSFLRDQQHSCFNQQPDHQEPVEMEAKTQHGNQQQGQFIVVNGLIGVMTSEQGFIPDFVKHFRPRSSRNVRHLSSHVFGMVRGDFSALNHGHQLLQFTMSFQNVSLISSKSLLPVGGTYQMVAFMVKIDDESTVISDLCHGIESIINSLSDKFLVIMIGMFNANSLTDKTSFAVMYRNMIQLKWLGNALATIAPGSTSRILLLPQPYSPRDVQDLATIILEHYLLFHGNDLASITEFLLKSPLASQQEILGLTSPNNNDVILARYSKSDSALWSLVHSCLTSLNKLLQVESLGVFLDSLTDIISLRTLISIMLESPDASNLPSICMLLSSERMRTVFLRSLGRDVVHEYIRYLVSEVRCEFLLKTAAWLLSMHYPELYDDLESMIGLKLLELSDYLEKN